ncbi:MAG: hypothetical protein DRP08_07880, partial [Candidatus Aenigmatarchaeota archaeon]
ATQETRLKPLEKEKTEIRMEFSICDMLLESVTFSPKLKILNTDVGKISPKKVVTPPIDLRMEGKEQIEKIMTTITGVSKIQPPSLPLRITDIRLTGHELEKIPMTFNTEISKELQKSISESIGVILFDVDLKIRTSSKQVRKLNTEVVMVEVETGVETLRSTEGEVQLPIFEEFIECDGRFPRGFSESFNSPFVVLIGENKREWHIPIIYALKEIFREITDRYPRVTFREPETGEEGAEERVDSLDPHSLDQFTFEYKIEFLDARKMRLAIDEFVRIVKGRLNSAFLQQFGVLVIAIRQKDLERARKSLKVEGIRVYTCKPNDDKYEQFCSKILGVSSLGDFFTNFKTYEKYLDQTVRRFSIFVKRGTDAADKLQYPLKVATFVYLLNELRRRKKKLIKDFEKLCKFVKEVVGEEIKIEEGVKRVEDKKIIPDLIYSPESGKEIFIEIETLIGTFEPMKKIDETVEKYKDCHEANIWIVLKPISALLHYEELKARKKAYEVLYEGKKVEFKVLTLLTSKEKFKWELVSLDEFVRGMKNVK